MLTRLIGDLRQRLTANEADRIQVAPTILTDRTGRLTPPTRLLHGTFGRLAPGAGDKDQSILPGLNQDRKDKRWDD